jgi:protein TonB
MRASKRDTKNQLKSNSNLFFQLGIVLALVIVYVSFETNFSKDIPFLTDYTELESEPEVFVFPPFELERKDIHEKSQEKKLPELLDKITIDDNVPEPDEKKFLVIEPERNINLDSVFADLPVIDEPDDESMPFIIVEQAPRYPGCKGDSEKDFKLCFNEKMKKFIVRKFNSNINISLKGKQRITVQFEIDKNGDIVNIKARAPHKRLEKEAIKAVRKLPKMEPGKQRNINVSVKYSLPISLYID